MEEQQESNWPEGAAPGILIASPQLGDPNFSKAVVLMIEHSAEGAVGIVLNRESDTTVEHLCEDQEIEIECQKIVRVGGPVSPERVWVIHPPTAISSDAYELTDDISISVTKEALQELAGQFPRHPFLVCAGYAGWGPGQLESEIHEGAWIPYPVEQSTVFEKDPDRLWSNLLLTLGHFAPNNAVSSGVN